VTEMTRSTRELNKSIDNRKTRFPAYFATYLEEGDVGPRRRNERRRWVEKTKRAEEGGVRGRERQRERKREVRGDAHLLLARLIAK